MVIAACGCLEFNMMPFRAVLHTVTEQRGKLNMGDLELQDSLTHWLILEVTEKNKNK